MVNSRILADTARLYRQQAQRDERFAMPSAILDAVVEWLGADVTGGSSEIRNSDQFIVVRSRGNVSGQRTFRHPLDLVERGIMAGVTTFSAAGMRQGEHTCLIAVPRGSLTATFTCTYEVVRRCGWSVLPLGGSVDGADIADLCDAFQVDTIVIAADAIEKAFVVDLVGRFDGVRDIFFVSGFPSSRAIAGLASHFPHLSVRPFAYISDVAGVIALPAPAQQSWDFEVLDHVLLEVNAEREGFLLEGHGELVVSILGLEEPALIRLPLDIAGELTTNSSGAQIVRWPRGGIS